jgi:hypothetical protein
MHGKIPAIFGGKSPSLLDQILPNINQAIPNLLRSLPEGMIAKVFPHGTEKLGNTKIWDKLLGKPLKTPLFLTKLKTGSIVQELSKMAPGIFSGNGGRSK